MAGADGDAIVVQCDLGVGVGHVGLLKIYGAAGEPAAPS
jgi:hypothetical protein